ncbi:DNA polymerase III subunit beta [Acetobacteraceae bacterium]|nr:DNA polymerase III subunit beta [Acetobacteraceae bacterium]
MKFSVQCDPLQKALSHVQGVAEKRNTIPILANVLLDYRENKLSLAATDMEIEMQESVSASGSGEGKVTVPATTLFEIIRKLPADTVEFIQTQEDGPLKIVAGNYEATLNSLSAEDFPTIHSENFPHYFEISGKDLRLLLDRTRFAMSTEETRYYLNGIYLHPIEGKLRAVATDGHRLALTDIPMPNGAAGMPGVIIPRKTVNELRKILGNSDEIVKVGVSESRIEFVIDNAILGSKLIDGSFPPYERVIPKGNTRFLSVDKVKLTTAVGLVSALSQERSRPVKFVLSEDGVILSALSPDRGDSREELKGEGVSYRGEEMEIGFQARYLTDVAEQIEGSLEFSLADNASPALIRDPDIENSLFVLMPLRV